MPRTTPNRSRRFLFRLLFFSLAGWVLVALGRESRTSEQGVEPTPGRAYRPARAGDWTPWPRIDERAKLERWEDGRRSPVPRRVALASVFITLFFAGAALTAGAGDQAASLLDGATKEATAAADVPAEETQPAAALAEEAQPVAAPEEETASAAAPAASAPEEVAPAEAAPAEAAPEAAAPAADAEQAEAAPAAHEDASELVSDGQHGATGPAADASGGPESAPAAEAAEGNDLAPPHAKPRRRAHPARASRKKEAAPVYRAPKPKSKAEVQASGKLDAEASSPGAASVVWMHRELPDPTPAARRLATSFAGQLTRNSRRAGVNWALVLGVLRAEGASGSVPADRAELRSLVAKLAAAKKGRDAWHAVLALSGRTTLADQAVALARYNRAVGLRALVNGLEAEKERLTEQLLSDMRVDIYPGGRNDLLEGRVDVRVVVLIEYLAEKYGQVTVSCLISGHRLYARPGVVSAHIYGHAVDISALDGVSVIGHQEPGGLMEDAVRQILLLPAEVQPRQVISLLGLGGPSFPLANHDDHLHVGY